MFLVDSSGWIEFFTDGPLAAQYSKYLKDPAKVITPSIVIYEVYKKIKKERTDLNIPCLWLMQLSMRLL